jgi:hypothetical protein
VRALPPRADSSRGVEVTALDLFSAGAERLAISSGLSVSQARARIAGTDIVASGPLFARRHFRVVDRTIRRYRSAARLSTRASATILVVEGHGVDCWCDTCCGL